MKTVKEIKKYLNTKYHIGWWINNKLVDDYLNADKCLIHLGKYENNNACLIYNIDGALNSILVKLWNDEEIIDIDVFYELNNDLSPFMIFLTNRNRMITCKWDSRDYDVADVRELNNIDVNKCRLLEVENVTLFSRKAKPPVYGQLVLDDRNVFGQIKLEFLRDIYNTIINHINKYKSEKVLKVLPVQETNSKESSNVKEIRRLYEDGIISKEEMLDLIKSIVKK